MSMDEDPFSDCKKHVANIKVAIRCRPPLEHESKAGNTFEKLVVDGKDKEVK